MRLISYDSRGQMIKMWNSRSEELHRLHSIRIVITQNSYSVAYATVIQAWQHDIFGYIIKSGGKDAFIDEFYIKPEFRRLGLGKATLQQIQQEAQAVNIHAIHLEVARNNTKAQEFYAQVNFSHVTNTY